MVEDEENEMSAIAAGLPVPTVRQAARRPGADAAPLRLTPRGRVVVFVLALLVGLGAMLGGQAATADAPVPAVPVQTYTVRAGETLWSIAAGLTSPGEDVRDVVDGLLALNDLTSSALVAGQQILLPAAD